MNTTPQQNKEILLRLMNISEEQYNNHQFEVGCKYIEHILPHNVQDRTMMLQKRHYWTWWVNQWNSRNRQLIYIMSLDTIDYIIDKEFEQFIKDEYELKHSLANIDTYPSRIVMDLTYEKMMKQLIKEEVKHE